MNQLHNKSHYQEEGDHWQVLFDDWLNQSDAEINRGIVNRIIVVGECVSTQDVCMELVDGTGGSGGVWGGCVAVHQTGGRGRLGRKWFDARGECASFTLAIEFDGCAERLAVRCGLATCLAAERLIGEMSGDDDAKEWGGVKIRWPNDVMVYDRKLAGVLIEVSDNIAFVGIGMNVSQREWPDELRDNAISLYEINEKCELSRPVVVMRMLEALGEVMTWDDGRIVDYFKARDCLAGRFCSFDTGGKRINGEVISLDPLRGLVVRVKEKVFGLRCDDAGCVFLPAGTTSLVKE